MLGCAVLHLSSLSRSLFLSSLSKPPIFPLLLVFVALLCVCLLVLLCCVDTSRVVQHKSQLAGLQQRSVGIQLLNRQYCSCRHLRSVFVRQWKQQAERDCRRALPLSLTTQHNSLTLSVRSALHSLLSLHSALLCTLLSLYLWRALPLSTHNS